MSSQKHTSLPLSQTLTRHCAWDGLSASDPSGQQNPPNRLTSHVAPGTCLERPCATAGPVSEATVILYPVVNYKSTELCINQSIIPALQQRWWDISKRQPWFCEPQDGFRGVDDVMLM
jgi:hypothetical protein